MDFAKRFIANPGSRVSLADHDTAATGSAKKSAAAKDVARNIARLYDLQYLLYAEAKRALLVVLQGMDTAGKDGTIRNVMTGCNPQGCTVTSFKVPTPEELAHDFLWRVHKAVPGKGQIGIFNRSHYEDVLVVRVHNLVPKSVWSKRYDEINAFERHLSRNGVTILKFFLHISKDEQKRRFLDRLNDPRKQWKVNPGDFEERKLWDDYTAAYEDALSRCSTGHAPWFVIPSDHKWFRDLAVSSIIVEALESLDLKLPRPTFDPKSIRLV